MLRNRVGCRLVVEQTCGMTAWLVGLSIVSDMYFNSILGIWGFGDLGILGIWGFWGFGDLGILKIKEKEIKADR